MRLGTTPLVACALALALAMPAHADEPKKEPAGLGLDDLGLDPVPPKSKKKAAPTKTEKQPWLKGAQPAATEDASKAAPAKAPPPAAPAAPPPAPQAAGPDATGVFVATPPPKTPPAPAPAPVPAAPVKAPAPAAPPLLKLATRYGIVFPRTALVDEPTAADVESGLKSVAFSAPMSSRPALLHAPAIPCGAEDDACLATQGAQEGVDEVIVATLGKADNALLLRVRRVDVITKKRVAETAQGGLSGERLELKAWSEALLCKQIVPAGCMGEVLIETDGAVIQSAGQPLPKSPESPERFKLPVGIHALRAVVAGKAGPERLTPVMREPPTAVAFEVKSTREGPRLVAPGEALPAAPEGAVAASTAPQGAGRTWTKPVGYTMAAVGAAALIGGIVQGARSKSMISSAESAYSANGGAYRPADLADLQSGNSAANSANVLFAVGGVLAAAGLVVAFAF